MQNDNASASQFKQRNVFFVIILSLVTFGIYYLYWLISTQRELVRAQPDVPSVWWMFAPLLLVIAAVVIELAAATRGGDISQAGFVGVNIIAIILGIIGVLALFIYPLWWFYKYCKAVEAVTNGRISLLLGYGSWIGLHIVGFSWVWPGVIQDGLNSDSLLGSQAPRSSSSAQKQR
jgi:cytochrome bd-type quinol oxidase subunit 2